MAEDSGDEPDELPVGKVEVELTWDPPFTIERMSEEVKLMLGFM